MEWLISYLGWMVEQLSWDELTGDGQRVVVMWDDVFNILVACTPGIGVIWIQIFCTLLLTEREHAALV